MKPLVLDVETTISNKGNPFDETNKLCYIGLLSDTQELYSIEYDEQPYVNNLTLTQEFINKADILVGFNIKFDLHWIRRYGISFSSKRIWDCQLVHFILSGQTATFPSLNDVASHYGLGTKLDVVSTEYWKNGIDTTEVPRDILEEYLQGDLELTLQVYQKQLAEVQASSPQLQRLVSLHNQDLLVLEEMEYNGLIFDEPRCTELAEELKEQIRGLDESLYSYHQTDGFNSNSTEHLSALLYGGTISLKRREVIGTFKSGTRVGQVKEKWIEYPVVFPKLINPLRGSELVKDGFFSTDEATLKSLKGSRRAKELVELLLCRATLEKRVSTYYEGLVKLRKEMKWGEGKLHGQLNQCVARTGRLSSSRPNLQNFDGEIKELFRSRHGS